MSRDLSSIIAENLVKSRMRENKKERRGGIKESAEGNSYYEFALDYRMQIAYEQDDMYEYQYPPNIPELNGLQEKALESWSNAGMHQYINKSFNAVNTSMDFRRVRGNEKCVIGITTTRTLDNDELHELEDWVIGQMSDGWGEGFEQREIEHYRDKSQEWVEDYDDDEGGYYDTVESDVYYYGQFWWSDSKRPWSIDLIHPSGTVTESQEVSYTLEDIQDMPYSSSFMKDRAELTIDGKRYVKIGNNRWEYQPSQSRALGYSITDKQLYAKLSSRAIPDRHRSVDLMHPSDSVNESRSEKELSANDLVMMDPSKLMSLLDDAEEGTKIIGVYNAPGTYRAGTPVIIEKHRGYKTNYFSRGGSVKDNNQMAQWWTLSGESKSSSDISSILRGKNKYYSVE